MPIGYLITVVVPGAPPMLIVDAADAFTASRLRRREPTTSAR
jgi:hypothetical protein